MHDQSHPKAAPASLPHSLRHASSADALDDARDLAFFLRDVVFLTRNAEINMEKDAQRGMETVMGLLIDKIEIADGRYLFPLVGAPDTTENLARRKER